MLASGSEQIAPPELPGASRVPDGLLRTDSQLPPQVPRPRPLTGDRFGGNYQKSRPSTPTQRGHRDGGKTQEDGPGLAHFGATHEDSPAARGKPRAPGPRRQLSRFARAPQFPACKTPTAVKPPTPNTLLVPDSCAWAGRRGPPTPPTSQTAAVAPPPSGRAWRGPRAVCTHPSSHRPGEGCQRRRPH